jgi:phage tail protein X
MNELYTRTLQGRTLLLSLVMLLLAPLSMQTFGQSPCTSPVVRQATNGKSTNANVYDDIAIAMTNLLGDGTEAAWVMESGGTFTENPDGTANFKGVVKQFGDYASPRRLALDIVLGGKSFTPDATGPYNQTGVDASGWYYYYTLSGSMTGLDALVGGKLDLKIHMHPFQVGIGANQLFNAEDQSANGAGGWFEWTVATQPTNAALQFTNYIPGTSISDFALLLSGTPSVPCPVNGSIGDQVYCDVNNNGVFDAGDVKATGLTVTLCDANFATIATQAVDADGKYLFTNLPAGVYNVKFPETTLDGKPQRQLGPINVVLAAGQNYLDADKGYYSAPPAVGSIGDQVYCDVNNNGIYDAGDVIVTGLTVTLCDANFVTIATQTVDANGKYLFTNLPAGVYNVKFPEATLDGKPQRNLGPINVVLGAGQTYLDADKGYYKAPVDPCATDTQAPTFTNKPLDITLTADCRSNKAVASWTNPSATDNCSTATVTSSHISGASFGVGTTIVTFTATDAKGNSATCTFKVIVNAASDVQAPVFTNCPTNIVKDVTGMTGTCWTITWTAPTATDNCSTPSVSSNYNSGYCFPVGVTTVIYSATDAKGNIGKCSFTVTIKKSISCTVSGNTISKSCANNIPVVAGAALANYEYVWLKSTTGCPTQSNQAIAGANGQNYALPCAVTQTTYFVRCARPIGCTTWGPANESNCVSVTPTDCLPTCSINFASTKSYRIVSKKSGKVLDISGAGTTNDCPVIQWGYHGGANQQWRLFSLGSGYFKVMARNSGKYLACHYTADGTSVYQYDYYSGGYKDWKIECVGTTGYYRFVHRASGKVLDVRGGSIADGAKMQIYTWTGADNQLFKIEEVTPAAGAYSLSVSTLAVNATAESDRVRLAWLTNTGYDNDFYTVEKMNNTTGDFEKIALVNNTQFDDQVQTHTAFDLKPTEGDNFYRVKVTMNDGFEKLTEVKKITFKRMIGFGAFPNPASDELNVNLTDYTGKAVDIQLYNTFGKMVTTQHIDMVANPVIQLNINDFPAGQYLIRVSAEGKRDATQQVVIQK